MLSSYGSEWRGSPMLGFARVCCLSSTRGACCRYTLTHVLQEVLGPDLAIGGGL